MGFLSSITTGLTGRKGKPTTADDVVAEIARLGREATEADANALEAWKRRESLILDGSDEDIESAEADAKRFELHAERCRAVLPRLHEMVASLRTAERNAKLVACLPAIREAARAVIPAAEAAVAALAALTAAKQSMMDAGFEHEASRILIPAGPITDQGAIRGARPVVRLNPLFYGAEEAISRALDEIERTALNRPAPPTLPDPAREAAMAEERKRRKTGVSTPLVQMELRAERERAALAAKNSKNAKPAKAAKGDAPVAWQPNREDSTTFAARTAA